MEVGTSRSMGGGGARRWMRRGMTALRSEAWGDSENEPARGNWEFAAGLAARAKMVGDVAPSREP